MKLSALHTRIAAALAALVFGSTGMAQAKVFDPQTFTLANGLQVVVVENHRAPVVTHMVWYRCGAADEKPGKTGIAHFLEHLMFKGTKTMGPGAFSAKVARYGGDENAFTASDYTAYFQSVAVERLADVMRLEADRMANLVLTDKEVLPERDVILEERRQRTDNEPGARLSEMMRASLFLNHPYRMPTIGWENEMRGLTTADALDWYGKWYAPNNAILIIAGDVTVDQVRPLAEKYYGVIAKRDVPVRSRPQEPTQFAPRRVTLESAEVKQGQWSRQYQAPSYRIGPKEDVYALEVLAEILGGNTTSRLYRRLVVDDRDRRQRRRLLRFRHLRSRHLRILCSTAAGIRCRHGREGHGRGDRPPAARGRHRGGTGGGEKGTVVRCHQGARQHCRAGAHHRLQPHHRQHHRGY